MKFCTKCGNEAKEEQTFCTVCGNNLKIESTNETRTVDKTNLSIKDEPLDEYNPIKEDDINEKYTTNNIKSSKKFRIAIALILIIIIVVIIQVGNSLSDPRKITKRFQQDIVTNNTSDLAEILYCNDARLEINSNNITPLLNYFKKDPSHYNKVIENLNNDALSPKDVSNLSVTSSNTLTLAKVGKKFLIFPNYKISIKPSFVDITTTVKDVSFSINNVIIGKSDTDKSTKEFGPYIPGTYSIIANYKGPYVTLSKPYLVNTMESSDGIVKLSVFEDMNNLNITSDYPDAEIFVNGKDTKVKVNNAANFGPIDSNSKIYATTVIDGKKLKSEEYSVAEGATDINISFEEAINNRNNAQAQLNGVKSQLNDLLNNYATALTDAINMNNFSIVGGYLTYGSELYQQLQESVPNSYVNGSLESVVFAKIIDFKISEDTQSGSITTSEKYNFTTMDSAPTDKIFSHTYNFQYNNDVASYQFTNRK
ncbi:zinc ribbon domain-containing protein [Clostridium estertheticum]|uniref:Membrane-associated protein TcaA n=1 Tax=Clostridium estertheticum TaxID=238834 RepID=A0AA47EF31_9CLOT|nr:zinc ribbon domain-containing protein [Clostridium estertheticum]MBU3156510.1 zinc ribbon domain-containing protein [Clostridium estertheticum]MCB2353811.1 zinc ribbon domain-containing protein [Clostridium estertheticum]WAG40489.1 zinc ribbon domain-containing protein [Clostridium estertheticum]WAG58967.1 zinc ribbon domain-containing protein [Clostridium estertheticum]